MHGNMHILVTAVLFQHPMDFEQGTIKVLTPLVVHCELLNFTTGRSCAKFDQKFRVKFKLKCSVWIYYSNSTVVLLCCSKLRTRTVIGKVQQFCC